MAVVITLGLITVIIQRRINNLDRYSKQIAASVLRLEYLSIIKNKPLGRGEVIAWFPLFPTCC